MQTVIGYTYEAAAHCPDCAARYFAANAPEIVATDREGNPVHAIASTDEPADGGEYCDDCGVSLRGRI